jgi:collagenase-like PrtC family protease
MGHVEQWHHAVDAAAALGADAVIMADPGLIAYAAKRHPSLRIHLSVQGSATHADAIELMREQFGIRRVVLPRVLTVTQIAACPADRYRTRSLWIRQPLRDGGGPVPAVVLRYRRLAQ